VGAAAREKPRAFARSRGTTRDDLDADGRNRIRRDSKAAW